MSPGPLLRPSEWLPPAKSAPANGLAVPTNGAIPPLAASKRERSLRAFEATGWRVSGFRDPAALLGLTTRLRGADEEARDHIIRP